MHADTDHCDPSDACGHVTDSDRVCFQGDAASAGVRPHRPADHGAAWAAGITGSSGWTGSAPITVSRKAQALRMTNTPGNPVRKTARNRYCTHLKPVRPPFQNHHISHISRDVNIVVTQVNSRWISDEIPAETHPHHLSHLTNPPSRHSNLHWLQFLFCRFQERAQDKPPSLYLCLSLRSHLSATTNHKVCKNLRDWITLVGLMSQCHAFKMSEEGHVLWTTRPTVYAGRLSFPSAPALLTGLKIDKLLWHGTEPMRVSYHPRQLLYLATFFNCLVK